MNYSMEKVAVVTGGTQGIGFAIGSTASGAPLPGMNIYGAIKAGFHGMVRAPMQDFQGDGRADGRANAGGVKWIDPFLRIRIGSAWVTCRFSV